MLKNPKYCVICRLHGGWVKNLSSRLKRFVVEQVAIQPHKQPGRGSMNKTVVELGMPTWHERSKSSELLQTSDEDGPKLWMVPNI